MTLWEHVKFFGLCAFIAMDAWIVAALLCAFFGVGCAGWRDIPVSEAYRIEMERCDSKQGDEVRACKNMVQRKYGRWLGEGGYPSEPNIPKPRD
jgi:hypothetical protein